MDPSSGVRWLGGGFTAAALLATTAFGCAGQAGETSASAEAEVQERRATFTLEAGAEARRLASCAPADRACYLRSLDVGNAYWLGVVSTAITKTSPDMAHPERALGAMTEGGLANAGLRWRELVVFDDNLVKSTGMYFETEEGVAVLSFRGSSKREGPANFAQDAALFPTCADADGTRYCVHKGFHETFYYLWSSSADRARYLPTTFCAAGADVEGRDTSHCEGVAAKDKVVVRSDLKDYLTKRFRSPSKPHTLYITGHSLGGAMAMLALNELLLQPDLLPRNVAVYTYGTPRVGNAAFAQKVFDESRRRNIPLYRFVYGADGVARARVPGYVHPGRPAASEEDGLDTLVHLMGDERSAVMSLGRYEGVSPDAMSISDHHMPMYLPVLKTAKLP